jgi:hypothetical protein
VVVLPRNVDCFPAGSSFPAEDAGDFARLYGMTPNEALEKEGSV